MRSDDSLQCMGQAESWCESKLHEIGSHAGCRTHDPEISHQCQTKTAANSGALNRSDDGFVASKQANCFVIKRVAIIFSSLLELRSPD